MSERDLLLVQLSEAESEIDRLKAELEDNNAHRHELQEANKSLRSQLAESELMSEARLRTVIERDTIIDNLHKQLAEAKTANLAIRSERDQAVAQLHAELAEASAENERLKRIVSSTERWEKLDGQLQQARQETAREIIQYIIDQGIIEVGWNKQQVYEIDRSDIDELRQRYGLEG